MFGLAACSCSWGSARPIGFIYITHIPRLVLLSLGPCWVPLIFLYAQANFPHFTLLSLVDYVRTPRTVDKINVLGMRDMISFFSPSNPILHSPLLCSDWSIPLSHDLLHHFRYVTRFFVLIHKYSCISCISCIPANRTRVLPPV